MRKVVDVILVILFVLFAIVQWNDPDSLLWILMYLAVAGVAAQPLIGKYYEKLTIGFLGVLVVSLLTYVPAVIDWFSDGMPTITGSMKASSKYIELVREFFGLLISIVAVGYYVWRGRRSA